MTDVLLWKESLTSNGQRLYQNQQIEPSPFSSIPFNIKRTGNPRPGTGQAQKMFLGNYWRDRKKVENDSFLSPVLRGT